MLVRKEEETEYKVCYELTKACEGLDRSKKEKEEMDVRFNNEPQQVQRGKPLQEDDDGINRINVDINDPKSAERLAEQIKEQLAAQQGGGQDYEGDDEDDNDEDEDDDDDQSDDDDDDDDGDESHDEDTTQRVKSEL